MKCYYVVSLCGCKGLLLDLSSMNWKWGAGGEDYMVIASLGNIKGEDGNQAHLLPCILKTLFEIQV
jgi:hypothetical protein